MVVPYDKKTEVGYRPIPETAANLKKMLAKVVDSDNADEEKKNQAFDALQELVFLLHFVIDFQHFCARQNKLCKVQWGSE